MGSGAYVCGEETALIESLEGHRGEPRNRPPFPIDTGYLGQPTIVNNVETFAWVVCILARGADWFKSHGTDKSTGYKLFSVSGDCERPGVYEFPMGITVAELLKEVGGEGAKAVQVGGASGQCVPAAQFDRTHRLRGRPHRRLDHRLRPAARHARRGRELPGVLRRRVVRPVYALPRRRAEAAGRRSTCSSTGKCSMAYLKELCSLGETMQLASQVRPGPVGPQCLPLDRGPFPGRDPRPDASGAMHRTDWNKEIVT